MSDSTATHRSRLEIAAWLGLLVVATVVRFIDLGDRPFHHDESQDAYFSYLFAENFDGYSYNPLLHGPVRFYMNALVFTVLGDSDFTARLGYALMSILAIGLLYLLRHQLGRVAAFAAAVGLAVGPSFLYFSRFAREDIVLAAVMIAMIVAAFRFLRRPHTVTLCVIAALVAVAYGVKESGGVLVGLGALFFFLAAIVQGVRAERAGGKFSDGEIPAAAVKVGWAGLVYAVSVFVIVYLLIFTRAFTEFECVASATEVTKEKPFNCAWALYHGLEYWSAQQDLGRGDEAPWLYPAILVGEDWPILLLGLVGTVFAFLRPSTLRLFLVFYFVGAFAFHLWGKERFAWLIVHPLVPLTLLAGVGVQALWELRSRIARVGALAAVALGFAYLVYASYRANGELRADPRSLLVSTQSSEQVKEVADQVDALGKVTITVDASEGATFPYAWYFRKKQASYPLVGTTQGFVPDGQVLTLTEASYATIKPNLSAYDCRQFDFRIWWVKGEYDKRYSLSTWWDYWTERKAWDPTGGMRQWFCVRRDVGELPGKGTASEIPTPAPPPK